MTGGWQTPVVPMLRFPEFRDAPDWTLRRGDILFDQINNRNAEQGLPVLAITQEYGAIPRDMIDYHVSVSSKSVATYKEVQVGDFIISLRSFQGGIEYSRYHGICSPAYVILRKKGDGPDDFYRHCFKSQRFIRQLTQNIEGLRDGKMISYAQFSELLIPAPEPSEQQKIADCLSSLDVLMAAENERLELLRKHKRGLMEQLFPELGKTIPRLGGQDKWQSVKLDDVVYYQEGPGIMAADFHDEGIPLVRLSGVAQTTVSLDGCNYLDPTKVAQKWEHFRLAVGDLVISTSASFGRVSKVTEIAEGSVFYTGLVRFRSTDERLSSAFLQLFLECPYFMQQVSSHAVGGGIQHFGPTHLRQMQIQIPSLDTQEHVAEVFSNLESCIEGQTRKLDFLHQHKQGLLQQLYPALAEE